MDKQRDQVSNNQEPGAIPFTNSRMEDNMPTDGSPNAGANDNRGSNMGDRNAPRADGDAGSTTFRSITPPRDPHAPPGDTAPDDAIADFGVEGSEVGYNGTVAQYGLTK